MAISMYLSIITLNVNGLNAPIKRYRMAVYVYKNKSQVYAAYERLTSDLKRHTD